MHARLLLVLSLSAQGAVACREVTVPDYRRTSAEDLMSNTTPSVIRGAVLGLVDMHREMSIVEGARLCTLGKECYWLNTNPNTLQFIAGPIEPGGFVGSQLDLGWGLTYRGVRQSSLILSALGNLTGFTEAEREGIRGFVKTMVAMQLLGQVRIRDTAGIAVESPGDADAPLPAIVSKDSALAYLSVLLDEAKSHLQNAGAVFAFTLPDGFRNFGTFNTPATFLQVNRGVKARVALHRQRWDDAIGALGESFLDVSSGTAATLARGPYHVFSTAAGDVPNSMFDGPPNALYAHPSIVSGAQLRANAQPDLRVTQKTALGVARSRYGVAMQYRFAVYASNVSPAPILRNEELILMRAEARYHSGDAAGALADINFIRQNSGGLPPLAGFASADAFVTELLYNRTYSLLLERGHRWVDARRYGRLAQLPVVNPQVNEKTFPFVMFPQAECTPRSPQPQPGCSQVVGIP